MNAPQMMLQQKPSRKVHIPNLLTLLRVVLAWVFIALLSGLPSRTLSSEATGIDRVGEAGQAGNAWIIAAVVVFILAAITDALDGHLARKWNAVTRFGRIMDPMADKLLIIGAFTMLITPGFRATLMPNATEFMVSGVAPWMVVAILMRELLVTSIRGVYEADGVDFSAGSLGKAKMVLQSITIPVVLLLIVFGSPVPGSTERLIIVLLVWATVITTLLSAFPYIGQAAKHTVEENARILEAMRGKKARKSTKVSAPSAKQRPKSNKGGQSSKKR